MQTVNYLQGSRYRKEMEGQRTSNRNRGGEKLMRRYRLRPCVLLVGTVVASLLSAAFCEADNGLSTSNLGKKIANVTWADASGKRFALHDLKDRKAVVVVFLSFECPVSNSYAPRLADMAR